MKLWEHVGLDKHFVWLHFQRHWMIEKRGYSLNILKIQMKLFANIDAPQMLNWLILIILWFGPVLVSHMRYADNSPPLPPPLHKWPIFFSRKKCAMFWNVCQEKCLFFVIFSYSKIFILSFWNLEMFANLVQKR